MLWYVNGYHLLGVVEANNDVDDKHHMCGRNEQADDDNHPVLRDADAFDLEAKTCLAA